MPWVMVPSCYISSHPCFCSSLPRGFPGHTRTLMCSSPSSQSLRCCEARLQNRTLQAWELASHRPDRWWIRVKWSAPSAPGTEIHIPPPHLPTWCLLLLNLQWSVLSASQDTDNAIDLHFEYVCFLRLSDMMMHSRYVFVSYNTVHTHIHGWP